MLGESFALCAQLSQPDGISDSCMQQNLIKDFDEKLFVNHLDII
jgi:hypothetical protein